MLFPVLFYLNFLHKFYCNLSTYSLLLFLLGPCFPRREQGLIYFYSVISCSFSLILSLLCTSYYNFSLISRSLSSFLSSYRHFLRFYLSPVSSSSSLSISPSLLFINMNFSLYFITLFFLFSHLLIPFLRPSPSLLYPLILTLSSVSPILLLLYQSPLSTSCYPFPSLFPFHFIHRSLFSSANPLPAPLPCSPAPAKLTFPTEYSRKGHT